MKTRHYLFPLILIFICTLLFWGQGNVQAEKVTDWLEEDEEKTDLNEEENINVDQGENEESIGSNNRSLVWDLIKMVFVLLLILALIYLLLRFLNKRNKLGHQVRSLENLGGISVGQNKSVQLIRVGEKIYLLGIGDNVELLQEIKDDDVREDLLHNDLDNNVSSNFLVDLFNKKISKSEPDRGNDGKKFKQLFSAELNKMKQSRQEIIAQHTEKEDKDE